MTAQLELPDAQQAAGVMESIYTQRFFDKLAELGIHPQTELEKRAALETALRLDSLPEAPEPTPQNNFFLAANEKLAQLMTQQAPRAKTAQEAYHLATEPVFYRAALALATQAAA